MTIPYRSAFTEIADHVYINKTNARDHQEILDLIEQAEERDRSFWGDLRYLDETFFIICDDENLIRKIGEDHATVNISFPSEKHYICISDEYLELDILAHEITHAELRARLKSEAQAKIPTWFDEGRIPCDRDACPGGSRLQRSSVLWNAWGGLWADAPSGW